MAERDPFSLPWKLTSAGNYVAGNYSIDLINNAWELRYSSVLLHTGLSAKECMVEADRHRGISRPGERRAQA